MNILLTGGAGYLGSVLLPKLLMRGHKVKVLDIGYFGLGHLRGIKPATELVREDIRRLITDEAFREEIIDGCDCVIHLAAISNDPSADLHPDLTDEVNFQATVRLAEAAKRRGSKFVFSSSCSVYGEADGELTEDGAVNPLTVYAISKVRSENALLEMADATWRPIILRNGTLFGYSPRMRFDLVINIFALYSTLHDQIRIFGDGMQWRPFLHVDDCARAFTYLAEAVDLPHICYNIASENLRVTDVAKIFGLLNPALQTGYVPTKDPDNRNYRVSVARMREAGFVPKTDVQTGAEQMVQAIILGLIVDPESICYRNARWLKELTQIGTKNHKEIVHLMEALAQARPTGN